MDDMDTLKQQLAEAAEIADMSSRRIFVLAVITRAAAAFGVQPILVGGCAVEFYTMGGYATRDVDVIMPALPKVEEMMSDLGFVKKGRYWTHAGLELLIESPAAELAGDLNRVIATRTEAGPAYVIGLEDLIIDRLNAYVHWESPEDGRWATRLAAEHTGRVDWDYLEVRAVEEKVEQALAEIRQTIERV